MGEGAEPGTNAAGGFRPPVHADDGAPSSSDAGRIRDQLARLLSSPAFEATDRLRHFLTYIVEEALAGRADRIKGYSIATDVFHRSERFDAHSDPIVRIEAARLRRALAHYYATAGQHDPIVISVPKGRYSPLFTIAREEPPEPKPALAHRRMFGLAVAVVVLAALPLVGWLLLEGREPRGRSSPDIPMVLVGPFDDLGGGGRSAAIAQSLNQEVIGQLVRFKDLVAIEPNALLEAGGTKPHPRYLLTGSVSVAGDGLRVRARLLDFAEGRVLWSNDFESRWSEADLSLVEQRIANQVVTEIAQPYGAIFRADADRPEARLPGDQDAYACTIAYYSYRTKLDRSTHPTVRACLEAAVERFPDYATTWALLAQTYLDEIRFRYSPGPSLPPATIAKALEAAQRAVAIDPTNVRGLQAEMLALWFKQEFEASLAVGDRAYRVNPNDTEFLGEFGFRLALAGERVRGCPMLTQARERNPGPLGYYEMGLALCGFFEGDAQTAASWARRAALLDNPAYHAIAGFIFAEAGAMAEAQAEREWLLKNAPDYLDNIEQTLTVRVRQQDDREKIIRALRTAGLSTGGP